MSDGGVIDAEFADSDGAEIGLRPALLDDFVGQGQTRENLRVFITAARDRDEALDHVLFHGPPRLPFTTMPPTRTFFA